MTKSFVFCITLPLLTFLTSCSDSTKTPSVEEEEAAYRLKTAPQREAAQWKQIEANFAASLEQQNLAEQSGEPL